MHFGPAFAFSPYRLSGTVYGTLMNHPGSLAALGDAVQQAPYKAPPLAPVLYIKPRNTLLAPGAAPQVPADCELEIGAALGIVLGRTACRLTAAKVFDAVAGYCIVADLCAPHPQFYRPSVRLRARDASCAAGPVVMPSASVPDPDALAITVSVDGAVVQRASTAGMQRGVAQLLVDVTEFMTLQPGDVLMLGLNPGAPRLRAGQSASIEIEGLGRLNLAPALAEEAAA